MIRANGYTRCVPRLRAILNQFVFFFVFRPESCVAVDPRVVPDEITSRNLSGPADALSPQSGLRFLVPLLCLDLVSTRARSFSFVLLTRLCRLSHTSARGILGRNSRRVQAAACFVSLFTVGGRVCGGRGHEKINIFNFCLLTRYLLLSRPH
jgi:hypothetical protein